MDRAKYTANGNKSSVKRNELDTVPGVREAHDVSFEKARDSPILLIQDGQGGFHHTQPADLCHIDVKVRLRIFAVFSELARRRSEAASKHLTLSVAADVLVEELLPRLLKEIHSNARTGGNYEPLNTGSLKISKELEAEMLRGCELFRYHLVAFCFQTGEIIKILQGMLENLSGTRSLWSRDQTHKILGFIVYQRNTVHDLMQYGQKLDNINRQLNIVTASRIMYPSLDSEYIERLTDQSHSLNLQGHTHQITSRLEEIEKIEEADDEVVADADSTSGGGGSSAFGITYTESLMSGISFNYAALFPG
jgi:hypothetical protein